MPQAIDRLLATPMMSPRLPCIRGPEVAISWFLYPQIVGRASIARTIHSFKARDAATGKIARARE
jgi:hypothetical protein